jgi:hypothetical protein
MPAGVAVAAVLGVLGYLLADLWRRQSLGHILRLPMFLLVVVRVGV